MMRNNVWTDNAIQFPRLLTEIMATQEIDLDSLAESMDLSCDEVHEIFDRAEKTWTAVKNSGFMAADHGANQSNNIATILQHEISWFLGGHDGPNELDASSVEHIERMIREGFNQGELLVANDEGLLSWRGWWSIEHV
jgi:hypothetical protein